MLPKAMWGQLIKDEIGWYNTPSGCGLSSKGAQCLSLNSAEFTIIPATTVDNIAKMELELAGPKKLNIAAATWDTDLKSSAEDFDIKPLCVTDESKVTCENI